MTVLLPSIPLIFQPVRRLHDIAATGGRVAVVALETGESAHPFSRGFVTTVAGLISLPSLT
jgi:hypothetical protein